MSTLMGQARSRAPRIAEAAVERARLTVVPRRRTRAPRVPFVTLVVFLLVGGVAGLLFFNTSMQQSSFVATSLEQRASALAAQEQSLHMDLEVLRDPQRVATEARRLGMVPAVSPAFIRLEDGKVLGRPAVATREDAMRIAPLPAPVPEVLRPTARVVRLPAASVQDSPRAADQGSGTGRGRNSVQDRDRGEGVDR